MSDLLNSFNNGRETTDGIGGQKPIDRVVNSANTSISGSLAYQKAVEYAKFKHQTEYYDKAYARDVEETIFDFQSGFATAMKIINK